MTQYNIHISINECSFKWASKGLNRIYWTISWAPSLCEVFLWPKGFFSAYHFSDSFLSGWSPEARHWNNSSPPRTSVGLWKRKKASWQPTRSDQQPPTKTKGGESSAAEQPVHRESVGRTGPLSLSLSLTSSACVSLIISFSLSRRSPGNRTQTGTWCWQQVADTPRFSAVLSLGSRVLTRLSVSCFHICCTSQTLRSAYQLGQVQQGLAQQWAWTTGMT